MLCDTGGMADNSANSAPQVLTYVRNTTGILELNRPKALNSLTPEMVVEITEALRTWGEDEEISQVLIYSNSERGFCAGGDVRFAREGIINDEEDMVDQFFRDEYSMNHLIATFPKPYVALIDGVVMGGGLGISLHGTHRVITENAFAAMPEMAIGYFTDIGFAYASQRMVGTKGQASEGNAAFIGLTGWRLTPADMLWCGIATHIISTKQLQNFMDAMIERGIDAAISENEVEHPKDSEMAAFAMEIEECFGQRSWADISTALANQPNTDFTDKVRELMAGANPSSVVASAELFTASLAPQSIREALDKEVKLGQAIRREPNFVEGVRAVLIDKDHKASFNPNNYDGVDAEHYRKLVS